MPYEIRSKRRKQRARAAAAAENGDVAAQARATLPPHAAWAMPRVTTFVALCAVTGVALAKCACANPTRPLRTLTRARPPAPRSMDHAFVYMDERRRARRAEEHLKASATSVRKRAQLSARRPRR